MKTMIINYEIFTRFHSILLHRIWTQLWGYIIIIVLHTSVKYHINYIFLRAFYHSVIIHKYVFLLVKGLMCLTPLSCDVLYRQHEGVINSFIVINRIFFKQYQIYLCSTNAFLYSCICSSFARDHLRNTVLS